MHVEDELDVVQVAQSLLEDTTDYEYATNLQQAQQRLSQESFDLVILDLGLPDGSGVTLFNDLKICCPVVIFSGQEPSKEISSHVAAALTKSKTRNEQLLATIKRFLNRT